MENNLINIGIHPKYPYLLIKEVTTGYSRNITYDPAESLSDAYQRMAETKNLTMCIICKVEERYKSREEDKVF